MSNSVVVQRPWATLYLIEDIEDAINRNHSLVKSKGGLWQREGCLQSIVRRLWSGDDSRFDAINHAFADCINEIELKKIYDQEINLKVVALFNKLKGVQTSRTDSQSLNDVVYRVDALTYRLGNPSIPNAPESRINALHNLALAWKTYHPLYPHDQKILTDNEKLKLASIFNYESFVSLLLADKVLQEAFFIWTFRDNNDPEIFIKYPASCEKIKTCNLAARIGRFNHGRLQANQSADTHSLTLPFDIYGGEVKRIDITNENEKVQFTTGYTTTVKKVMECFAEKVVEPGEFEMINGVVRHWNNHEVGYFDQHLNDYYSVDLSVDHWWQKLPLFERLDRATVIDRYKIDPNQGYAVCVKATRETPNLAYEGRHGYLEVIAEIDENNFGVYPFGLYAKGRFPSTTLELLMMLANTVRGTVTYPDENVFFSHREHTGHTINLTREQGAYLFKYIKQDIIKSQSGNMIFQFPAHNCAYWASTKVEEVTLDVPNFFKVDFLENMPNNPILAIVIKIIKIVPKFLQGVLIQGLDYLLLGFRSYKVIEDGQEVKKSVINSPIRQSRIVYQSGLLFNIAGSYRNGFRRFGFS